MTVMKQRQNRWGFSTLGLLATLLLVVGCGDDKGSESVGDDASNEATTTTETTDASAEATGDLASFKARTIEMFSGIGSIIGEVNGPDDVAGAEEKIGALVDAAGVELKAFLEGGGDFNSLGEVMEGDPDVTKAQAEVDAAGEALENRSMEAAESLEGALNRQMQKFMDIALEYVDPDKVEMGRVD